MLTRAFIAVPALVFTVLALALTTPGGTNASTSRLDAGTAQPSAQAAATGQANIWVAPSGGSCLRSASPQAFNGATACGSLNAANAICQGGDTVLVQGGTYPAQTVTGNGVGRSASSRCTFSVPDGAVAVFGCNPETAYDGTTVYDSCVDLNGSYLTLDGGPGLGFRTKTYVAKGVSYQGRSGSERGITAVTLTRWDMGAFAFDGSNTTVSKSDLGPSVDGLNNRWDDGDGNVLSDNLIHDFAVVNGGHFECLTWDAGTHVVIQRNLFENCAIFDIFSKPVENTSGLVDGNVFWEADYNNDNLKVTTGSGASRCDVSVSNNWFMTSGLFLDCPGAVDGGGNTYHSHDETPPDPRRQ
jgi:hypothetical protein